DAQPRQARQRLVRLNALEKAGRPPGTLRARLEAIEDDDPAGTLFDEVIAGGEPQRSRADDDDIRFCHAKRSVHAPPSLAARRPADAASVAMFDVCGRLSHLAPAIGMAPLISPQRPPDATRPKG